MMGGEMAQPLIATLRFVSRGGDVVHMSMQEDGSWVGNDRHVMDYLNLWYHGRQGNSPSRGSFGRQIIEMAALRLAARLEWHDREDRIRTSHGQEDRDLKRKRVY